MWDSLFLIGATRKKWDSLLSGTKISNHFVPECTYLTLENIVWQQNEILAWRTNF